MRQSREKNKITGQTQERRKRIRRRVLIGLAVMAVLTAGVWAALSAWIRPPVVPNLSAQGNTAGDSREDAGAADWDVEIPQVAQSGQRDGVYTFLLAGQDTAGGGNTDTMILFTYDVINKTVRGMNLPRDTMINVSWSVKKLNSVYNYYKGRDKETQAENGMAALKKEVSKLTGIVPNFYVLVQWEAVGELVDALGGVYFEVPFDMDYDDPTPGQDLHIHQKAGWRRLSGDDAMQVVRWRKNNNGRNSRGDVGRIGIQQDFLKALAKQCLQPSTLLKAPALAQVFLNHVTTDLELGNLLYFAQQAREMDADGGVVLQTMPWTDARYPGISYLLPAGSQLLEMLNGGLNPYLDEIKSSDLQILYRNSDGSYGVTSGTLADSGLARPRAATQAPAKTQTPAKPDLPEQPEQTQEHPPNEPIKTGEEIPIAGGETETEPGVPEQSEEGGGLPAERPEDMEGVPEWMLPDDVIPTTD